MASDNLVGQAADSPMRLQEGISRNFAKDKAPSSQPDNRIDVKQAERVGRVVDGEKLQSGAVNKTEEDFFSSARKKKEEQALEEKVGQLNDFVQNLNRDLHFSVHKETGRTVVTVVDAETEEVIRKIPSDEILRIAESLENLSGLLLNKRA